MKVLIVLVAFVAAASASLGLGGVGIGNAAVLTNVRTIQPIATNVITPVVTPVVRSVLTPVVSRVVSPVIVGSPVVRTVVPVQRQVLTTSRLITPVAVGGVGLGYGYGGLGGATIIGKK